MEGFPYKEGRRPKPPPESLDIVPLWQDLARQNPGRHKEEQFLGRYGDRSVFEQIADQRHAAQKRYLIDFCSLVADHNAANDYCAAIINQNLGFGRLGIESRGSVNARDSVVDLS